MGTQSTSSFKETKRKKKQSGVDDGGRSFRGMGGVQTSRFVLEVEESLRNHSGDSEGSVCPDDITVLPFRCIKSSNHNPSTNTGTDLHSRQFYKSMKLLQQHIDSSGTSEIILSLVLSVHVCV